MKLVIDIDEKAYEQIKRIKLGQGLWPTTLALYNSVQNGTPLPKGHGELKDADAMINKLCTQEASELFGSTTCAEIMDFISDEKPIIEGDKEG